jgi:hypothetical protein
LISSSAGRGVELTAFASSPSAGAARRGAGCRAELHPGAALKFRRLKTTAPRATPLPGRIASRPRRGRQMAWTAPAATHPPPKTASRTPTAPLDRKPGGVF